MLLLPGASRPAIHLVGLTSLVVVLLGDAARPVPVEAQSRRLDRPGLVKVYCHLLSHMSALVRVFDHPWFAVPDAAGRFTIAGLPPGRHEVAAWREPVGEVTPAVVIADGRLSRLSFSLPLTD